jgi:pilus assembly protein CpaE
MITAGVVIADQKLREDVVAALETLHVRVAFAVPDAAREAHRLESTSPDLLVLDFSQADAHAVMAELKRLDHPVAVVATHTVADPEAILGALRSGAREFLYPPLNEQALRGVIQSVEREKVERDLRSRSSKAVGVLSAAGGCGATTVACHVAAELRRTGAGEIALLDFDLAAGTAGFWFGVNGDYSVLDAVHGVGRMDASLWRGYVTAPQPHLDLLTAPSDIPLGGMPGTRGFSEVLRFARCQYDWVVADLAQHLTPLSLALLGDLDTLFVVTTPEVTALLQTRRMVQKIIQHGYFKEKIKVIVNRSHKDQSLPGDLHTMLGVAVEATLPEDRHAVADAHSEGRLISARSDFGNRIANLTAKLTGKPIEVPRTPKFPLFRFRAQEA